MHNTTTSLLAYSFCMAVISSNLGMTYGQWLHMKMMMTILFLNWSKEIVLPSTFLSEKGGTVSPLLRTSVVDVRRTIEF